jgi:hypothetical protein
MQTCPKCRRGVLRLLTARLAACLTCHAALKRDSDHGTFKATETRRKGRR